MILSPSLTLFAALSIITFGKTAAWDRNFNAAPKHPSLKRSEAGCGPTLDQHELVFAEDSPELFVATVKIEPIHPMLILEDIDDHIRAVKCSDNELVVEFHDTSKAAEAVNLWGLYESFVLVTHEPGCQVRNEHTAWNVSQPSFQGETIISFTATLMSLKKVTRRMGLEFGEHLAYKADRRRLAARQAAATVTAAAAPSFSFSAPTGTATALSFTQGIGFSEKDKVLIAPEGANVSLSCVDCTLEGAITLKTGTLTTDPADDDDDAGIQDFFSDGFIDFEANNINAHMKFALKFLPGFKADAGIVARLPSLPLPGILVAGLLQFGPVLDLVFPLGISLNKPVTLTTGFKVTAPPSLLIHLNVSDPLSSDAKGFSEASLEDLPFTADADQLDVDFFIGFRPELRLNARVGAKSMASIEGGVGVYLELPMLTANVAQLTTSNEKCKSSSGKESLYLLSPSIAFGSAGVLYDLDVGGLGISKDFFDDTLHPFYNATATPLDPQCLKWDAATGKLADPKAQVAEGMKGGSGRNFTDGWSVVAIALMALFMINM